MIKYLYLIIVGLLLSSCAALSQQALDLQCPYLPPLQLQLDNVLPNYYMLFYQMSL